MKTSFKRIQTTDGLELVGLLYEPEVKTEKILVHVHGMQGNFYENRFLDAISEKLTSKGIAFFTFNNRGCEVIKDLTQTVDGKKKFTRIGNAYEKFEECILDIDAAVTSASTWGFSNIHLSGHSLGCPKVVYYLSETKDTRINSVLLLSPSDMVGLVKANPERYAMDIKEAHEMVAAGKGEEFMGRQVWDEYPISAASYLSLFAEDGKVALLNFHNHEDTLPALSNIEAAIFVTLGRKDDCLVVPIEETLERITKAAKKSRRVETKILGDANHGYIGDEQNLADAIYEWISSLK